MIVSLDHPSGVLPAKVTINGQLVAAELKREPLTRVDWTTHDYNVHFCIGLENNGDKISEIELSINGGEWHTLPETQPLLYAAEDATALFQPSAISARTDLGKKYCLRFSMPAGSQIFVANTLVRSFEKLKIECDELGASAQAERRVIGKTLEGRSIIAYLFGDPNAHGTLLVTSGFHPPEPDTLATMSIMQFLATPEGKALLKQLAIAVVPVTNPDGYANGTQGSNAAGINFYWHFAHELPDQCPEASALWKFSESLKPRGYLDFHCYTFQLAKKPGPYQRPIFFYNNAIVKKTVYALYRQFARDSKSQAVSGFSSYAPHTLGAMLTWHFDTIALAKYHLHLAEGETGCRKRGLKVFLTVAEKLIEYGVTAPGAVRGVSWKDPLRHLRIVWAGLLRPNLGWLRRGIWTRHRLGRTALVEPGKE